MTWLSDFLSVLFNRNTSPIDSPTVVLADPEPITFPLSVDEMRECVIACGCPVGMADVVATALTKAFIRYHVVSTLVIAHVLAHCAHESQGFTATHENMNYSSVARIRAIFGRNRGIVNLTDAEVEKLVNNPEALANIVYADSNRVTVNRLGNIEDGDGFKFRAWGWAQLTGRDAITLFARFLDVSIDDVLSRSDPEINASSALWFAMIYKRGFAPAAMMDNLTQTTVIWNGGLNGLEDRQIRLDNVKRAMKVK